MNDITVRMSDKKIAQLTAELAEAREGNGKLIDELTADLAAKDEECEGLRELLGSLLGAIPLHVLRKWPNITKRAREAAAGGEGKLHEVKD